MTKPTPTTRCATCNEVHEYHHSRGYRAADGHAYAPTTTTYPPLAAVPEPDTAARLTTPTPDDYEVMFGQWAFCRRCGGSTSNTAAGMASHRALHAELEQLRADVDRLTRLVGRGGGAA